MIMIEILDITLKLWPNVTRMALLVPVP